MKTRKLILVYLFSIFITGSRGQFTLCTPSEPNVTCIYALPMQPSVMLTCDSPVIIPSSSEWYFVSHFSTDVTGDTQLSGENDKYDINLHQLFIKNATINDTGIYRCIVSDTSNDRFNGSTRYNLTVLKVPQFTNVIQTINVTEGQNFALHYEITYTDGIGSTLVVVNVQIRNGSIETIATCNIDSKRCNTPSNDDMRISPSIVASSEEIDTNVTISNAIAQDSGQYLAIASATFFDMGLKLSYTSSYTATIIVDVIEPTTTPMSSIVSQTVAFMSTSLSSLPATPTPSVPPDGGQPLQFNAVLVAALTALAVITVIILLSILITMAFLLKYCDCSEQDKKVLNEDNITLSQSEHEGGGIQLSNDYNSKVKGDV